MQLNIDYPLIGGSPLFPNISCEAKRDVCIVTTGEGEINAAATSTCIARREIEVLYRGLRAVALTKDSLQSPLSLSAAIST